jgi:LuxR family maltose regulon positive regulatory protein
MKATLRATEFVPRPRVERRLRDIVESTSLTLLHAPLGAGKTVAVSMAFAQAPGAVWMNAQPWHRGAFVRAIVDAIRSVRSDFGRMTLGAMEAGAGITHAGRTFARELAHIDEPLLLIVDNLHVFTGEPGFSHFVDAAVSALPPAVRIVALGRSLPDITLGKSFIRGRAAIVEGDFLVFESDEIRALGALFGRTLDDESIAAIAQSTEGWATGVMLAVTASRGLVPAAAGPRSAAEAYLTKELLPAMRSDLVRFLENTSVFDTLDLRVLAHGKAFAGAHDSIVAMRRAGAPVTEDRNGSFRVHPLLRDLAGNRLRKRKGENVAHRNAAEAYALAGEISAALFHADAAGDAITAADFLRTRAQAAVATGDHERVRSLVTRVDPNTSDSGVRWYTEGLLEKARACEHAQTKFERAAEAASTYGNDAVAFAARAQIIEYGLGHLLRVDDAALADARGRAQMLGVEAQATVGVLQGWAFAINHDFQGALASIAALSQGGGAEACFNAGVLKAYSLTASGDIDAARDTLDALIGMLENDDRVVLQSLTLVWFARLALAWGHTTAAADAAAAAERLASALDLRAEEAALYAALAEIATHTGDVKNAVRYAEFARGRATRAWYAADKHRVRAFGEIVLARAAFLGHDNAIARDLTLRAAAAPDTPAVQRAIALSEGVVYTLLCEPGAAAAAIESARAAIARAAPIDVADAVALAVADDILAFLDAADGVPHETSLVKCEPFAALLKHRRGLVTLELAGVAVGNARHGTASAVAFETALEQITRDGPRFEASLARAYASRFIKPVSSPKPVTPPLDLTPRENEILILLVDGLTNKEIAQRLILSPRTIETHVERVLGKLEVGSRSRAIAKAIRLGFVSL